MQKILDLGMHPYADSFIPADKLTSSEPIFPLQVGLTPETGEIRLIVDTDARDRYNLYEYSYTSANSQFSRNHWDSLAKTLGSNVLTSPSDSVLEIGSNDGYLLEQFITSGYSNVFGIDASATLVNACRRRHLNVECGLFNSAFSKDTKFDLIVANNVVNHANDTLDFFVGVKNNLSKTGTFVFELPYWMDTITSQRVEQVYHEHVTYFTLKYANHLCKQVGLHITDFELVDYHGGSIRVYVRNTPPTDTRKIDLQIEVEENAGLFDTTTYGVLSKKLHTNRVAILQRIYELKSRGVPIVAIGAAAKGNTLLNYLNLDHKTVDYVTDGSVHKIGKYTPLSRIPIVSDAILSTLDNPHVFFLAWNIQDILLPKLLKLNPNITVIESSL